MYRLQLLLSDRGRTDAGREALADALTALGCTITGRGEATLSIRIDEGLYSALFEPAQRHPGSAGQTSDATRTSANPGRASETGTSSLRIPSALQPFLTAASIAPAHTTFASERMPSARPRR